jgi:hypothetical protein
MKGFSGKEHNVKEGDTVTHPNFYGHKNIKFTVSGYDIKCGEMVRNNGSGGKVINLDICHITAV